MILITSGAYIEASLKSEFGYIPPSFLPIGNKRLYLHQLSQFSKEIENETIYLSVPDSYTISDVDKKVLTDHRVQIIKVPDNLSIGLSIFYSLNKMHERNQPVRILYGDTLIPEVPIDADFIAVGKSEYFYDWAESDQDLDKKLTYCGYFSFENIHKLIDKLFEVNFDFISAVRKYSKERSVKETHVKEWLDFGHINTFYCSKAKYTTQRVFNKLTIKNRVLTKQSEDKEKMSAESFWYQNLPFSLKVYTPMYLGTLESGYALEYLNFSALNELLVFGNQSSFFWKPILDSVIRFIEACTAIKPDQTEERSNNNLYLPKTQKRLQRFADQTQIDLNCTWTVNKQTVPSLNQIIAETAQWIQPATNNEIGVIHGDLCFSNILFDFKNLDIKVIDPRGLDEDGNYSIYGDVRYDIAKLSHSILGNYDLIIANYFELNETGTYALEFNIHISENIKALQKHFAQYVINGVHLNSKANYAIMVHLFLSMLPLHYDNPLRQKAFLANALCLYIEFNKK
ncbi:hypothetical protein [Cytophaga aurantiaca]|uniref:hypothetical protein n=1 Tax=Cytophaga aurantiaca TaxID=29530 RepID=UPI00036D0E8B|nr:hypothetical protein [Cytophaga aurantiaca]